MSNIIYIPWAMPLASEFLLKSQQWVAEDQAGNTKNPINWQIVMYQDPNTPLSGLKAGSSIYVRGHGGPGDPQLDADVNGQGSISYEDVCDRMISDGLKRTFMGTIKISCCNSGVPKVGHQAFAAKCSHYMRFKKGYLLISFVGYMGPISSEYYEHDDWDHAHRHVRPFGSNLVVKSKWAQWRF